jgi:hypothetical protein
MTARKSSPLIIRITFSLLFVIGVAIPLSAAVPAASARAATCTPTLASGVWKVPYGCGGVILSTSHRCQQTGIIANTGGYGPTTTDECADIAVSNSSGGPQIWGEGEFYCQGAATECQGMNVSVDYKITAVSGDNYSSPNRNYKCNPDVGFCPIGKHAMVATQHFGASRNSCYFAYSVDPADGQNGDPQVISVEGYAAHAQTELESNDMRICFG